MVGGRVCLVVLARIRKDFKLQFVQKQANHDTVMLDCTVPAWVFQRVPPCMHSTKLQNELLRNRK